MLLDRDAARRTDTVLATRVEKSVLDPYIALAHTLGLRLCTIDLAQAGLIRLVQALPEHSRRTFILLVFEGETFSASLFENGQYKYATRGACSTRAARRKAPPRYCRRYPAWRSSKRPGQTSPR